MRIIHICTSYFDESSFIGGAERYLAELARLMAQFEDTTVVSFSTERKSYQQGNLRFEIYNAKHFIRGEKINPLCFKYLGSIKKADIVHVHHLYTLVSDLGCLTAFLLGKPVFVSDYGGGSGMVLSRYLPIFKCYRKAIAFSHFGLRHFPAELQKKAVLFRGGIDMDKFSPDANLKKENKILYTGRILPHKGINYLIEAFRLLETADYRLIIIGKVYDEQFYSELKQLSTGLPVEFTHDATDQRLLYEYRSAKVTVLPSVHTSCYGNYTPVPELMGFALLESQACGTPVICTDAGAMSEFVDNGCTGFIVRQNSAQAIADALHKIINLSQTDYMKFQADCREWVRPFSWPIIVQKYLELYKKCAS